MPAYLYVYYKRMRQWVAFANMDLLREVYRHSSIFLFIERIILSAIFVISVIICANPWYSDNYVEDSKKWIDISVVLDISKSMLAEDILPSRIQAAKTVIWSFLDKLDTDRISFVLFAWKPYVWIPLTFDYAALKTFVANLTTDSINQQVPWLSWTAIWDALLSASDSLVKTWSKDWREKVIILVTDWEANVGIDPKLAVKYVNDKNIKIYSIWIWKKDWTELYMTDAFGNKQYFVDNNWKPILAKLDEDMLTYISKITNWKYYNAQTWDALKNVFAELSKLNKSELKLKSHKIFVPAYMPFVIAISVLLILLFVLKLIKPIRF